jgi:hypothetical protein
VVVSAVTLLVLLGQVEKTGRYADVARPLGLNMAAAKATRSHLLPGTQVLIGGSSWEVEILGFSLGHDLRVRIFDDCAPVPVARPAVYVLNNERSPAASVLSDAGAPLLARVPRPDGAFLVYGDPPGPIPSPPACPLP